MASIYRIVVLISGYGSNLQALIDAAEKKNLPVKIVRVISDKKDAYGLERAKRANIPTTVHGILKYYKGVPKDERKPELVKAARISYDEDLAKMILSEKPDLVVCAGFMRILSTSFLDPLDAAKIPIINLHPSKPSPSPACFPGICAIERAWEAFQQNKIEEAGIMVHYVIKEVDMGKPIMTKDIPMKGISTLEEFESKIHEEEWKLIVKATKLALEALSKS